MENSRGVEGQGGAVRSFVATLTTSEIAASLLGRVSLFYENGDGARSFAQFLLRHKFSLARVLTPLLNDLVPSQSTHDSMAVCKMLIEAYGYHTEKLALSVARCIIFEEVRLQTDAGTLFRANSTATTFMASFAREIGKSYLDKTLSPIVKKIVSDTKKGAFYEVDPLKVSKASEVKVNSKNYEKLVRSCVKAIVKSTPIVPTGLREICAFLRESISHRFPDSKYLVVGGFFFLRFFCPAFLNPQSFMELPSDALTPVVRRTILLVCKFIQTIANDQNFNKEPYMMPFNPLLEELTPEVHAWFDTLAVLSIPAGDVERGFTTPVTTDVFLKAVKELHAFHNLQLKRIVEILASRKEDEEETSHSYFDETQLLPFLSDLSRLQQLPDFLPEDKVRYESYSWEEESSQSSGPLPEALPAEKRKSGLFALHKKSKSAAVPIPVHEAAKERRKRGASSSGPPRAAQSSQVSVSPSQSKKWSLKNIMGQRPKSQSAEFIRSAEGEPSGDARPAQLKTSASSHLEENNNSSPRFGASPHFSMQPGLRKSSSGAAGPYFGRARADSQSSARGLDALKNSQFSRSASSLPSSSDHASRPSTKSSDEGSTEYRLSSEDDIEERERSQYPDDAPEEDPDASESRPPRPNISAPKISTPPTAARGRGSGTWRVSDAASGQESSDLDLSASLHDESVAHD